MIDAPLDPKRTLAAEVRQVADALLEDAELRLRLPGEGGFDKAVHESRKRIKEVRSLLRLLRDTLVDEDGKPLRAGLNDVLRDTAHLIGPAREAAVAIETLDALKLDDAKDFRAFLLARHDSVLAGDVADAATDAATRIAMVRGEIDGWHLVAGDWNAIRPGLNRVYRQGRRAMLRAFESDGDAECWHDWRKRAKDLRYAAEFFRASAPYLLGGVAGLAKRLTDALGDDHDFAELASLARDRDEHAIADVAEAARYARQAAARTLGTRAFAERPGAFVDRLGIYWRSSAG